MKINTIKRDSYTLSFSDNLANKNIPIFVIGSRIYYERLFKDEIYNDIHFVFLDHRGFVIPDIKDDIYTLDSITEDIEAIRKELGYEKIYLLGHSGHGFMAMDYADKYTNHVEGLILSNLAPTNSEERQKHSIDFFEKNADTNRKNKFYSEIEKLEDDLKKDVEHKFTHMNIRFIPHSFYDYNFKDADKYWDDVDNNINALDYLWGDAFAKYDTYKTLEKLSSKIKILLILSEFDFLVASVDLWDEIVEKTKIKRIVLDKSGHNPMLEEKEKYHNILKDFIKN